MSGIPIIEDYSLPKVSELPKNIANWEINPARAVLLIHDMQQFFVDKLPNGNLKENLLKNIATSKNFAVTHEIPVAYTQQPGSMTDDQRGLLKSFWGSGMKALPRDREIVKELKASDNDWLFPKWRYSAFYKTNLLKKLNEAKRDQLIICGIFAHIGILTTAVESFSSDIETFLLADAIADFSLEKHMMSINYIAQCCAVVLNTEQLPLS